MKTAGIITEYNPFHKGHQYQIRYTKEKLGADYIIAAMSGDYVQRGTPALLPKAVRTEMALRCGADLVLELPVSVSCASAEFFAGGGVALLDSLGVVDMLCFGSEAGEIGALTQLASVLANEPEEYRRPLKELLSQGLSFPAARSQAILEFFKNSRNFSEDDFSEAQPPLFNEIADILASPNNILGIEYCKALLRQKSEIEPVTVKRKGSGYHDSSTEGTDFASATAIRGLVSEYAEHIPDNDYIQDGFFRRITAQLPEEAHFLFTNALKQNAFVTENDLSTILHYCLLRENADSLQKYLDVSPDLAQRIINQRNAFRSFSQFAALLKTKEITQTRLQRALLHILLDIREVPSSIPYARVLGFRKDSSPLLKAIKKNSRIPLITKLADAPAVLDAPSLKLLEKNTFASNLYESILSQKTGSVFTHEYCKELIIV